MDFIAIQHDFKDQGYDSFAYLETLAHNEETNTLFKTIEAEDADGVYQFIRHFEVLYMKMYGGFYALNILINEDSIKSAVLEEVRLLENMVGLMRDNAFDVFCDEETIMTAFKETASFIGEHHQRNGAQLTLGKQDYLDATRLTVRHLHDLIQAKKATPA